VVSVDAHDAEEEPMSKDIVDPPWLDEAVGIARSVWITTGQWYEVVRAVLAFAARQPREITDAMVQEAAHVIWRNSLQSTPLYPQTVAHAALEAAEKARADERA
jgi:hypothetical protein